jgi:hypothetical protein
MKAVRRTEITKREARPMEVRAGFKEIIFASMWCALAVELRCSHSQGSQMRRLDVQNPRITPIKSRLYYAMLAKMDISPLPVLY